VSTDERARTYHRWQFALSLTGFALSALYLVALLATGTAEALRDRLATLASAWWLQIPLCLIVLAGAYRLMTLPLSWLGGFWLPRRFGLLHQPFLRWLWDGIKAALISGALGLLGVEIVYGLMRQTPRWWLWAGLVFFAAYALLTLVAPVWLVPLFYRLTPLGDQDLSDRLLALARRAGVPVLGVWIADQSRKSRTANAAVTGLGRTRRVLLFDTLVREFTPDETEAVLGHELAHHVHADIWRGLAVQGALTLATFWAADKALRAGSRALHLGTPWDPAGLPLFGLILMAAALVALPLANGWSRHVEREADDFALRTAADPTAFITALERLGELNLAEREPHPLKEFFLYSHPSIGRRVARATARLGHHE
jgi:Zn-dependent protease with chaperone function